jgi:diguanylate cyclase (GGDEF)-like protein
MSIRILLIEDDYHDTRFIEKLLRESSSASKVGQSYEIVTVTTLQSALDLMVESAFDAILMDLNLPDSSGLESLEKATDTTTDVPVVVITGIDDEETAVKALEKGAQDYLTKGELGGKLLSRSLTYAIERHRLQQELKRMSIVDELTGLYNRRGFFTLGEQEFKLAKRSGREFVIIFADLDGLKKINDNFGHEAGDNYIQVAADFLKNIFRDSDILARIGGDEFAIIAYETTVFSSEGIRRRIDQELARYNRIRRPEHILSISVGTANFNPQSGKSLDELLSRADSLMYQNKKKKKSVQGV